MMKKKSFERKKWRVQDKKLIHWKQKKFLHIFPAIYAYALPVL